MTPEQQDQTPRSQDERTAYIYECVYPKVYKAIE